jgi:hypothetical protein
VVDHVRSHHCSNHPPVRSARRASARPLFLNWIWLRGSPGLATRRMRAFDWCSKAEPVGLGPGYRVGEGSLSAFNDLQRRRSAYHHWTLQSGRSGFGQTLPFRSAPMAVVPGRLAVVWMRTFGQVCWLLLRCPQCVNFCRSAFEARSVEIGQSAQSWYPQE